MFTNLEYRTRERQRKGESRRQFSKAKQEKGYRDLEQEFKKSKGDIFFRWKNNIRMLAATNARWKWAAVKKKVNENTYNITAQKRVQTGATTPNIVAPKMLGVVACVLAVVCKRMQQLSTSLGPAVHRGKNTTHKALVKPSAHGGNIVCQQLPTLLDVTCCIRLHTLLDVVACCCAKFETGQTFQPTTPNISFVPWSRSVTQQCWIRLHSSSNVVGATHAHYAWIAKTYGLYSSKMHCRSQTCWKLLHPFAHHSQHARNNSQHCWPTLLGAVAPVCTQLKTFPEVSRRSR